MMNKTIEIKLIQEDGRVFIDMPTNESNPCLNCGACCNYFRISFYHGECEGGFGGFVPQQLTNKLNEQFAVMKGSECGGRCIALEGEVGKNISCSIYSNRPTPCREFPVFIDGKINPLCNKARLKNNLKLL